MSGAAGGWRRGGCTVLIHHACNQLLSNNWSHRREPERPAGRWGPYPRCKAGAWRPVRRPGPDCFHPCRTDLLKVSGVCTGAGAASCDRQVSTPHVYGPVYPPHLLRWRALRLRPQLSYWAIMHLFRTEATHALALLSACGSTVLLQHMSVLLWHACCNHLRVGRRQYRQCSLASAARAFVLHRQMAVQTAIPSVQHRFWLLLQTLGSAH
jgi:hypothetical protein